MFRFFRYLATRPLIALGITIAVVSVVAVGMIYAYQKQATLAQTERTTRQSEAIKQDKPSAPEEAETDSPEQDDKTEAKPAPTATPKPASPAGSAKPSSPQPSAPVASPTPQTPVSTPAPAGCSSAAGFAGDMRDPWGGCWPGNTTTGVPAGTTLTEYTGPCTITAAGTVIEAKRISCMITIQASNVIIRKSKIDIPQASLYGIRVQSGSVIVEDTEIDGGRQQGTLVASGGAAINGGSYTLKRVNVHHVYEGPRVNSNVTIEDSYIHHLVRCQQSDDSCHVDALQSTNGSNIVIRHNTILSYNPDVGDIFNASYIIKADLGNIDGVLVERNYMSGGNYTVYVRDATYTTRNVTVRDNYFGRDYRYGTHSVDASTGTIWGNNRFSDGSVISL